MKSAGYQELEEVPEAPKELRDKLKPVFAQFDQDGSGTGPNQDMEDLEASPLFFGSAGFGSFCATPTACVRRSEGRDGNAARSLGTRATSDDARSSSRDEDATRCAMCEAVQTSAPGRRSRITPVHAAFRSRSDRLRP